MSSSWLACLGSRLGRSVALACGVLIAGDAPPLSAAEAWPQAVAALYRISFNGFDIGTFRFRARVDATGYVLDGSGELSALLGAFSWQGLSRSSGAIEGDQPRPGTYSFEYRSSSKSGAIRMGFRDHNVASLAVQPQSEDDDVVPLRPQHLKGVLDPLSAVMRLTRADGRAPCGKHLSIFDGKQRFDLQFAYARLMRVAETRPSGLPSDAVVCRVRYTPIAGHKRTDESKSAGADTGIEVTLRPVPSANLLVPTRIVVPTMAGSAVLTSERIDIETSGSGAIALVY